MRNIKASHSKRKREETIAFMAWTLSINNINYEVELLSNGKDKRIVHASNMKMYNQPHKSHFSKTLERLTE